MSIVMHYKGKNGEPYEHKKLMRMLYVNNNISEIINSDGLTMLDVQRDYMKEHHYAVHPFYALPMGYNKLKHIDDLLSIYEPVKKQVERIYLNNHFVELKL